MKKELFIAILICFCIQSAFSQTARVIGPAERSMRDSLCGCVMKLDISKITSKAEATAAYTGCVEKYLGTLKDLADERKVDIVDKDAMEKVGVDLAMDLLTEDCKGFRQLALIMGGSGSNNSDDEISGTAIGNFKRIENKGFNYVILVESSGEKSFLWLKQFPGSEKFMNGTVGFVGKKMKISWLELEVYLPQAKGYYKVKEITGIELL